MITIETNNSSITCKSYTFIKNDMFIECLNVNIVYSDECVEAKYFDKFLIQASTVWSIGENLKYTNEVNNILEES